MSRAFKPHDNNSNSDSCAGGELGFGVARGSRFEVVRDDVGEHMNHASTRSSMTHHPTRRSRETSPKGGEGTDR
jgi:hypothetical protein